jgi:hypothetical protein
MHFLSTMFKVALQIAVVLVVPGGLPAVLIYQYRRLQKRRRDAIVEPRPTRPPAANRNQEVITESPL